MSTIAVISGRIKKREKKKERVRKKKKERKKEANVGTGMYLLFWFVFQRNIFIL